MYIYFELETLTSFVARVDVRLNVRGGISPERRKMFIQSLKVHLFV